MKVLNYSNSCVNCDNLVFSSMTCGVHELSVSEKYTCSEFEDNTASTKKRLEEKIYFFRLDIMKMLPIILP